LASIVEWMSLYGIQQNTDDLDSMTEYPDFQASVDIGVEGTGSGGGVYRLMLENRPALTLPSAVQELNVVTGRSDMFIQNYESTVAEQPIVTIEGPANSYIMSLLFWSLFQTGTSETTNSLCKKMTCVPYNSADPEMFFSLVRVMVDPSTSVVADDKSHFYTGCLVRSITLTAEERGIVKYSAEIMGSKHRVASAGDLGTGNNRRWTDFSFPTATTSWKWQNFTCEYSGTAIDVGNWSITFSNNATGLYYNHDSIQGYKIGRLTVEGTMFVPWSAFDDSSGFSDGNKPIDDYKNDNDFRLEFFTDDGADQQSTGNDVDIDLHCKITDFDMSGDVEVGHEITFSALAESTSTQSVDLRLSYLASKLIRGVP